MELIWKKAIIVNMLSLIAHFRPSLNTSLSSFPQLWDKCSGNYTNLVTFSSPSFQEHNICAATTLDSQLWLYFNTNTAGKTSRDTCWHTQTPSYCPYFQWLIIWSHCKMNNKLWWILPKRRRRFTQPRCFILFRGEGGSQKHCRLIKTFTLTLTWTEPSIFMPFQNIDNKILGFPIYRSPTAICWSPQTFLTAKSLSVYD